jgi:monoamine oxidase
VRPGLAAAQQLERRGHKVVVVEGHSRPGGRVYTKKMEASMGNPLHRINPTPCLRVNDRFTESEMVIIGHGML